MDELPRRCNVEANVASIVEAHTVRGMITPVLQGTAAILIVFAGYRWLRLVMRGPAGGDAQGPVPGAARRSAFITGLALLLFTVAGPLHALSSRYLFLAHTVQMLIITLAVPPLVLAGLEGWMLRPLLQRPAVFAFMKRVTGIRSAFVIFNVLYAVWHMPVFFNAALHFPAVHFLLYATMLAAAFLMWWPLMSPLPELPRAAYPAQMLYCFLMVLPMSIVSIYIVMSDVLLYPAYAIAPRLLAISPMQDQQYGGLVMWLPGGIFFYAVMTVVFFRWSARGRDDVDGAQAGSAESAGSAG